MLIPRINQVHGELPPLAKWNYLGPGRGGVPDSLRQASASFEKNSNGLNLGGKLGR